MGNLSEDFDAAEFACPCGKCDKGIMSPIFMQKVQRFRTVYGKPLRPVRGGGFRCKAHNAAIGGADDSFHVLGRAVDFEVPHDSDAERYQMLRIAFSIFGGVGINNGSIHVDDRDQARARAWDYYGKK